MDGTLEKKFFASEDVAKKWETEDGEWMWFYMTQHPKHIIKRRSMSYFHTALKIGDLKISIEDVKRELKGKNLACWCKIGEPCHADVLLKIANEQPQELEL